MSEKVFELKSDIKRLSFMERGDAYDLKAFDFSKMSELRNIHKEKSLDLPETTFFYKYSTHEYVSTLDNLHALQTNCIYSKRMIDVLLSVRDFKHRLYPVAILEEGAIKFQKKSDGYVPPKPYGDPEFFKLQSIRDDLFILQTLEFLDVFDWEKSKYRKYDETDTSPGSVKEYVFKEPSGGYPPLFRLPYHPVHLFISGEARAALKKAGIRGIAFSPLEDTWQSEVDLAIS
jgi:hypothetical protein